MFRCTRLFLATTGEISAALAHMGLTMAQAADAKTLRARYLDLTRRNHPDAGGDERTMRDVIEAFRVLGEVTPAERAHYSSREAPPTDRPTHPRTVRWMTPVCDEPKERTLKQTMASWGVQLCVLIFVVWMLHGEVSPRVRPKPWQPYQAGDPSWPYR